MTEYPQIDLSSQGSKLHRMMLDWVACIVIQLTLCLICMSLSVGKHKIPVGLIVYKILLDLSPFVWKKEITLMCWHVSFHSNLITHFEISKKSHPALKGYGSLHVIFLSQPFLVNGMIWPVCVDMPFNP